MKPPFSPSTSETGAGYRARIAERRNRAREIVAKQRADEDAAQAGARMQAENKRIHGQPPSREGGTPKTPTPPNPNEGATALVRAMAMRAHTVEQGVRGQFRRTAPPHQPGSGDQQPPQRKTPRNRKLFIGT